MAGIPADVRAGNGVVESDDELAHYGVLGMRWGKRRKRSSSSSSEDSKAPTRPDPKKMTDDELKRALSRLKMEKEFLKLTEPEKTRGQKIADKLLQEFGTLAANQARNYVNGQVTSAVNEMTTQSALKKAARKAAAKAGAGSAVAALSRAA